MFGKIISGKKKAEQAGWVLKIDKRFDQNFSQRGRRPHPQRLTPGEVKRFFILILSLTILYQGTKYLTLNCSSV